MALKPTASSDLGFIERHRQVWEARPELRSVYYAFFDELARVVGHNKVLLEFGSGPGFFKEHSPNLIATDVCLSKWVDLVCDGSFAPFAANSIEGIVMLDVLHHIPHPLNFMKEAARVLKPGGTMAMIEPWISPASYILYRYFHHEDCILKIDLNKPFGFAGKTAFDGNATIPYNLVKYYQSNQAEAPLRLVQSRSFAALPYLATFGFKRTTPVPRAFIQAAEKLERLANVVGKLTATRALLVWQKPDIPREP